VKYFEEKYNTTIPIIAAGGIYTGADIKKIMDLKVSVFNVKYSWTDLPIKLRDAFYI
jgi:phosphoribosylformimino-5-aminoimidazole carboxamide ribonucleotide (ProFAR) isomerase